MSAPHTTLEQWRCLIAVVEQGGYARASETLHKSQSAVTYAIQKLEQQLGVKVFEIEGRRAVLTDIGRALYQRARTLVGDVVGVETAAARLAAGWEAELRIVVDALFPTWLLLECLGDFTQEHSLARIELLESVLSGAEEALLERRADMAITSYVPPGFVGEQLMRVRFLAVASPRHPLHLLGRELSHADLRRHRQLVVRDSGSRLRRDAGWLQAEQRLTVTHMSTSIGALCRGLGFAWLPEEKIRAELAAGELVPLPLTEGAERFAELYLVIAQRDLAGPATLALAQVLRRRVCELKTGQQANS